MAGSLLGRATVGGHGEREARLEPPALRTRGAWAPDLGPGARHQIRAVNCTVLCTGASRKVVDSRGGLGAGTVARATWPDTGDAARRGSGGPGPGDYQVWDEGVGGVGVVPRSVETTAVRQIRPIRADRISWMELAEMVT